VAVSAAVLQEAERNLANKFNSLALNRYDRLLQEIEFVVAGVADEEELRHFASVTGFKDAHVLAAAVGVNASVIVTLDRPLITAISTRCSSLEAMTPGDFIEGPLKTHPEYLDFRGTR
jgi:predicted nucleic acid-binding protein